MIRIYRFVMVLVIMVLVCLGLNTSNQGINSLTMDNRESILGINRDNNQINLVAMGKDYEYENGKASITAIEQNTENYLVQTGNYLLRIWKIFRVVVLQ